MANLKRTLCLLPLMVGCYSYTPITPEAAPVGWRCARESRAPRRTALVLWFPARSRVLVGNIVENNAGAMILQVPMGAMPNIAETIVPMQTRVPINATDLVSLERRTLDATRTTILITGIVTGIATGIGVAIRAGGGSEPGKTPEEPPPIIRIPIWRFRIP